MTQEDWRWPGQDTLEAVSSHIKGCKFCQLSLTSLLVLLSAEGMKHHKESHNYWCCCRQPNSPTALLYQHSQIRVSMGKHKFSCVKARIFVRTYYRVAPTMLWAMADHRKVLRLSGLPHALPSIWYSIPHSSVVLPLLSSYFGQEEGKQSEDSCWFMPNALSDVIHFHRAA